MHFCLQNQFTFSKCIFKVGCVTVVKNERSIFKMRAKPISAQLFGDCYMALSLRACSSLSLSFNFWQLQQRGTANVCVKSERTGRSADTRAHMIQFPHATFTRRKSIVLGGREKRPRGNEMGDGEREGGRGGGPLSIRSMQH